MLYQEVLAESDQILLFSCPWPPSGLWAKKAVISKAAIENLKIRTYDPSGTITFNNIGAAPIQLSWSDVIPQLTTGGIDAVLTSAESGVNGKFWELLSHFNELNYTIPLSLVHMNRYIFDGLSKDLQQTVKDVAASAEKYAWDVAKNRVMENYEILRTHNVNIVNEIPQPFLESLKEASQPAMDDWLKKMGTPGEEIIQEYNSRIKQ
ncbi:MAG: hypothetical protein K9K79_02725 [Desulfohalobiaceae bacterium]|nr:hypothetical protein [Desulfohalobiaceae bacterium]